MHSSLIAADSAHTAHTAHYIAALHDHKQSMRYETLQHAPFILVQRMLLQPSAIVKRPTRYEPLQRDRETFRIEAVVRNTMQYSVRIFVVQGNSIRYWGSVLYGMAVCLELKPSVQAALTPVL